MEPLQITLTSAGLAIIAADGSAGFGPAQISQIGLTNTAFTAASTLTAIPDEIKRLPVNGEASGGDQLHAVALDASDDVYDYRGFGLYLSDGTLFAAYSQGSPIAGKAEVSATYLAVDIQLEAGQTANITFGDTSWINPPASTTRQGVVELATNAEAKTGTDATRAITPSSAKAAVLDWIGTGQTEIMARKLEGKNAAAFVLAADFTSGSNANGYWRKTPDGFIEQWGETTANETNSPSSLNFPITFTDLASINLQVTAQNPNTAATAGNKVGGKKVSITQFNVHSDDGNQAVSWRAIGR